jgi:Flp pilus assembly protein TadG
MTTGHCRTIRRRTTIRPRLVRDQGGSVLIWMAISIVGLFAFAIVAIDGSILMTTKTQLQNAADAAALAGASQFRSTKTFDQMKADARDMAFRIARANLAVQDTLRPVIINPAVDVQFPTDADGNLLVQVTTHRTVATGDPLRTYFLRIMDLAAPNLADVSAIGTAVLVDNCAATCIKPWAIPDRWQDNAGGTPGEYDQGIDFYDPVITGYQAPGDVGFQIQLHLGNKNDPVAPGQYFSIDLPPLGGPIAPYPGADNYRTWIYSCAPFLVQPGDSLLLEPGAQVGPTRQGMQDLIAQDPGAYYDSVTKTIKGSAYGQSPRVALVPFYDPNFPPQSGRNNVKVTKIGAFFMESVDGAGQVTGRFIQESAAGVPCDTNTGKTFLVGLHLVENQ